MANEHDKFRQEVEQYQNIPIFPYLCNLAELTGIPVPQLKHYILAKYGVSANEAILSMKPTFFGQLLAVFDSTDEEDAESICLSYMKLKNMLSWLESA